MDKEIKEVSVNTYTALIYVGLLEHYWDTDEWATIHLTRDVHDICQQYVDATKLCVTITATEYVYTDGYEPGVIVGLINYPRFPVEPYVIREKALTLAYKLKEALKQYRVSVQFPDKTIMLEDNDVYKI